MNRLSHNFAIKIRRLPAKRVVKIVVDCVE